MNVSGRERAREWEIDFVDSTRVLSLSVTPPTSNFDEDVLTELGNITSFLLLAGSAEEGIIACKLVGTCLALGDAVRSISTN